MIMWRSVPALVSSLVARIVVHRVPGGCVSAVARPGLLAQLAMVPDFRDRRGRRHALVTALAVAVCAVLAGAKSLTAIGEWAADAPPDVLVALGIRADPWSGSVRAPDEATLRRVLTGVNVNALDAALGAWTAPTASALTEGVQRPSWRPVAVDGKTLRGSGPPGAQVHLLAARDHVTGAVLAQAAVDRKSNEITAFAPLLDRVDLTNTVVTSDALHTQSGHAIYLTGRVAGRDLTSRLPQIRA
jgi:hypothetical protein